MSRFNSAASTVSELCVRLVTFFNKGVGTDNLTNDSVTRDIINSNVAGSGLSQDADGSLKISNAYIIETGSNSNGYYRKWSDGTLECWFTSPLVAWSGTGGYYLTYTWTFPAIFYSSPTVLWSVNGDSSWAALIHRSAPPSITSFSPMLYYNAGDQTYGGRFMLEAKGRWKA